MPIRKIFRQNWVRITKVSKGQRKFSIGESLTDQGFGAKKELMSMREGVKKCEKIFTYYIGGIFFSESA